MNARVKKSLAGVAVVSALTGAAAVGGCAATPDATMQAPIDARVQALVDANRRYPRWEDFPPQPQDLPAPVAIAQQVNTLRATGGALAGEVSRLGWTLDTAQANADAIAARAAAAAPVSPETAQTQAEVDAFAARLRARGRAPAPVDRR